MREFLVVIPARGYSRRIPRKNLHPLAGKPLLLHTIETALASRVAEDVVVSTEDDEVAALARAGGARIVERPVSLATDTTSTESVMLHVLDRLTKEGREFRWVVTLPPTSPLRKAATVQAFAEEVRRAPDAQDCLMSVTESRGDYWLMDGRGVLSRLFPEAPRRQQDRQPLYEENSAIYVTSVAAVRATGSILGRVVRGLIIDPLEAVDINVPADLALAELLLARR